MPIFWFNLSIANRLSVLLINTCEGKTTTTPVRVSRIFSRSGSIKSSIPNFKIKAINWPKYRANIIHHFISVFFLYFSYHSSCRKDQFTALILKFGTTNETVLEMLSLLLVITKLRGKLGQNWSPENSPIVPFGITLTHFRAKITKWIKMTYSLLKKRQGNWTELTFAKTSGIVTRDREKKLANSWSTRHHQRSQEQYNFWIKDQLTK